MSKITCKHNEKKPVILGKIIENNGKKPVKNWKYPVI